MSKHTQQQELPYKDVEKTLDAILYNIKYVKFHAYDDPYYNLRPIVVGKRMLSIDRTAQKILKKKLETIYSGNYKVQIWGEEDFEIHKEPEIININKSVSKKKKNKNEKIICLLDPIDGTDLFAKKLGNWCTAVVIYTDNNEILASFIGLPNETIYFSVNYMNVVAKKTPNVKEFFRIGQKDSIPSGITFSWYGQKVKNFLSIAQHEKFLNFIKKEEDDFRILNISGNPAMVQMVDNEVPIGVIVELCGQHPHDMIPGAYLAQKAGAILTDLNGKPIKFEKYLSRVQQSTVKYILASSKEVYDKFFPIFKL